MTIPQGQSPAGWQGQWTEQTPPPPPPQRPSRSPLYFLIFATFALLVAIALVFYAKFYPMAGSSDPGQGSSHSASVGSNDKLLGPADPADLGSARDAVVQLAASPQCTDTAFPARTAQTILNLADLSTSSDDLATSENTLTTLSAACGGTFTGALREAFSTADLPSKLENLVDSNDWVTLTRPAPAGALAQAEFTTGAENIRCRFVDDDVACSIYAYDYPSPPGCEGKTATYRIDPYGDVSSGCTKSIDTDQVVEYGTSIAQDGYACTLDQSEGVTCWNEVTGTGFQLKRASGDIF
ncbi:MAG: hypothetical protein QM705_08905 [Ancrocorticia sp.]